MKRYKSYLESVQEDKINRIFKLLSKNCSKFINELKLNNENKEIFFRGFQENIEDIEEITRRKGRNPKDLGIYTHNEIDSNLFDIFGWKPRSEGVFATVGIALAKAYNTPSSTFENRKNPYIFFPIGDYSYVFNKDITDIYDTYDNECLDIKWDEEDYRDMYYDVKDITDEDIEIMRQEKIDEQESRKQEIIDGYQKNRLQDSYPHSVEVIFNCDTYYLINYKYLEDIKKFIYSE